MRAVQLASRLSEEVDEAERLVALSCPYGDLKKIRIKVFQVNRTAPTGTEVESSQSQRK